MREAFFLPRQVGADPPLYFLIAALPIRALASQPIEIQLRALRLLGVLTIVGSTLCAYAAARELCTEREPRTKNQEPRTENQRAICNLQSAIDNGPRTTDDFRRISGCNDRPPSPLGASES